MGQNLLVLPMAPFVLVWEAQHGEPEAALGAESQSCFGAGGSLWVPLGCFFCLNGSVSSILTPKDLCQPSPGA